MVRLHDLRDDREAETGPGGARPLATPEPFENVTALVSAGFRVHGPRCLRCHWPRSPTVTSVPGSGVSNRILDQISDRVADRVSVPSYDDRLVVAMEGDRFVLRQRPGRHACDDIGGHVVQVDAIGDIESNRIKSGNSKKLIDEPIHAGDIGFDLCNLYVLIDGIESRGDDRERRAKLVGCICGELVVEGRNPARGDRARD